MIDFVGTTIDGIETILTHGNVMIRRVRFNELPDRASELVLDVLFSVVSLLEVLVEIDFVNDGLLVTILVSKQHYHLLSVLARVGSWRERKLLGGLLEKHVPEEIVLIVFDLFMIVQFCKTALGLLFRWIVLLNSIKLVPALGGIGSSVAKRVKEWPQIFENLITAMLQTESGVFAIIVVQDFEQLNRGFNNGGINSQ